jgi:metallo-beta-lactamase class B
MKVHESLLVFLMVSLSVLSCGTDRTETITDKEIYNSGKLIITRVAEHSFIHTSFKQTNDFGNVPCNGLVVRNGDEVIVFDTPTNDEYARELIRWIRDTLHCRITAVVPTHFHDDCLGGLNAFDELGIASYGHVKTIELANKDSVFAPRNGFKDSIVLNLGNQEVMAKFHGEGHTKDNVVGYFPADKILFGGCLIKEVGAGKGYLGDANVSDWSATVEKIREAYPNLGIVVPGHGKHGSKDLLDFTINLFKGS